MKKIEKKIKNSIQIPNLSFSNVLPKSEYKKEKPYWLSIIPIMTLIVLSIPFMHYSSQNAVLQDDTAIYIHDYLLEEEITFKSNSTSYIMESELQDRIWKEKEAAIDEINEYYKTQMKSRYFASGIYELSPKDDYILQAELQYAIQETSIYVRISENTNAWNVDTSGLIHFMLESAKSIIQNKQIALAKRPKRLTCLDSDVYYALYAKDNLYYFITATNIEKDAFIQFLKEYII